MKQGDYGSITSVLGEEWLVEVTIFGGSKTLNIRVSLNTKFSAEFSIIFSFNDLGKGMALFYELTWTQGQDSPVLGTTVWSLGLQTSQLNDFCHPLRRLVIWHQQVLLGAWKYVVCNVIPYIQCSKREFYNVKCSKKLCYH